MTPREEKFIDVVNSVARDLIESEDMPPPCNYWEKLGIRLQEAIKEFCGQEPTPMEKAQQAAKVGDFDDLDGSEAKQERDEREIAQERMEDTRR